MEMKWRELLPKMLKRIDALEKNGGGGSGDTDLTNYYDKQESDNRFASKTHEHDEYVTESELNTKGYLTEHQDISGKANVSDLTSHTDNKSNPHGVTASQAGALPISGGKLTGQLKIAGSAASQPLMTRGIVGSDGADTVAELYLQYGVNKAVVLGNEGTYNISADGSQYSGNATTATKFSSAKTITLSGDVSGSVSFDGSNNVTMTTTVADDSHNHVISNVDGLQDKLNKIDTHLSNSSVFFGDAEADETAPLNADQLNGKSGKYYTRPYNLLDNSDFRNPVNQRGQASYTGTKYTIDRWYSWCSDGAQTVSVENGFVRFKAGNGSSTLSQRFTKGVLDSSKKYTLAYKTQNGVSVKYGFTSATNHDYVQIIVNHNETLDVEWVALYEGEYTAENLPPYLPKGYANELHECQRYFYGTNTVNAQLSWYGYAYTTTEARITIPIGVTMRSAPSTSFSSLGSLLIFVGNGSTATASSAIGTALTPNGITLRLGTSGLTANYPVAVKVNSTFSFSSDL